MKSIRSGSLAIVVLLVGVAIAAGGGLAADDGMNETDGMEETDTMDDGMEENGSERIPLLPLGIVGALLIGVGGIVAYRQR